MIMKESDTRQITQAVSLIDDKTMMVRGEVQSGWDADLRGNVKPDGDLRGLVLCTDGKSEYGASLKREIAPISSGQSVFFHSFEIINGSGYAVRFYDNDDRKREMFLNIAAVGDFFTVNDEKVPVIVEKRTYHLTVKFDLDRRKAEVLFDERSVGSFKLRAKGISCVRIGIDSFSRCTVIPRCTYFDANFLVIEHPYLPGSGAMPEPWKLFGRTGAVADRRPYTEGGNAFSTYALLTCDEEPASLVRHFVKSAGCVCFEIKYLAKRAAQSVVFSLLDGKKEVLSIRDEGGALKKGQAVLREHHVGVWQYLRIEADTDSDSALIKLNGKKCGKVDFDDKTKRLDGFKLCFRIKSAESKRLKTVVDILFWKSCE